MEPLINKKCKPCHSGDIDPFDRQTAELYAKETPEWKMHERDNHLLITRTFEFLPIEKGFVRAMEFVNKVADIAETEGHHPDITISYNNVTLDLWTHGIDGLSENDFILATKIDQVFGVKKAT